MDDVVIVGGGIAGSALATVLARAGLSVTVLERQRHYQDRVRGEFMSAWGVASAMRMDLFDVLAKGGALVPHWQVPYGEETAPEDAQARRRDTSTVIPGVPGPMCFGHPQACQALADAAEASGARYLRGTGLATVRPGPHPEVVFEYQGANHRLDARIIVGADGRNSAVRKQAGIPLFQEGPAHVITGLHVDGAGGWPQDSYTTGGEERDLRYYIFPQGAQRVRLYLVVANEQQARFAGPDGAQRFLEAFQLKSLPRGDEFAAVKPIGPCATYGGEETWTETPFVEGVALVGDAGGYSDPAIGQGLALTMCDVEALAGVMLSQKDWSPYGLQPYAVERFERSRRVRFTSTVLGALNGDRSPAGRARRAKARQDPRFRAMAALLGGGPDPCPAFAFEDSFRHEVLSYP
jgi:2-polyprenyl-6-methoxyphenol hydroxylase-like FAD-dependent oxidoreductase